MTQKVIVSPSGPFIAEPRGNLDFWPIEEYNGSPRLKEKPEDEWIGWPEEINEIGAAATGNAEVQTS